MALVPSPDQTSPDPSDLDKRNGHDDSSKEETAGGKMSFLDHLNELRRRLIVSFTTLFVGVLICLGFIGPIFDFIMEPLTRVLPEDGTLVYTEPTEAFFLNIKMAALAGLLLATPVITSQVWLFVAPGLYAHEKKFAIPFVVLATGFFVGGALFAHYLLFPIAWGFFASFGSEYMAFMPRIQPAFALYVRLVLACGVVFQLPTVVLFLARMGVVTHRFLIRNFKYAILFTVIFGALLTPPDVVTQLMLAAPMLLLYLLSIGIAWLFGKPSAD